MGLDYSVSVGYGFFWPDEESSDLVERLGRGDDYEIDGWPDRELLEELGYRGLQIVERHSTDGEGGWAICAVEGYRYIDPRSDDGIWALTPAEFPKGIVESLAKLRDWLFPPLPNGGGDESVEQPQIGWFLISSIY